MCGTGVDKRGGARWVKVMAALNYSGKPREERLGELFFSPINFMS